MGELSSAARAHEDTQGVFVPFWLFAEAPSLTTAILLAQITWYFQPSRRGGDRVTFVERDGHRWLAVTDRELGDLFGLSDDVVFRARSALKKAELLVAKTVQLDGVKCTLIRPNAEVLARRTETALAREPTAESREGHRAGAVSTYTQEDGKGEECVSPDNDTAPEYGFEHFWEAWPRRNGKRLYRDKALACWRRLKLDDKKAAWRGAVNYAAASAAGQAGAMDAFRWLRDGSWVDWQTPASPPPNGRRPASPIADHQAMVAAGMFDDAGMLRR